MGDPSAAPTQTKSKTCCYIGCERPALLVGRCHVHFPGYKPTWSPYKTSWWRTTRKKFIERNPFCTDPFDRHPESVPAAHVDHIVRHRLDLRLFMDPGNLQSLCVSCHGIKTAVEDMGPTKRAKRDMAHWFRELGLQCVPSLDGFNKCYVCQCGLAQSHAVGRVAFCSKCCPACLPSSPRRHLTPGRNWQPRSTPC
ncbi:HNH endonuclease signature motif containing protein [uncultured Paludibaculum sp.]|uniref:HNH endonuclease signature motif containing protein n=1 Tax=uncultured Paludibaculum sp. TaxID=1765020 RepID=UPI00374D19BF